MSGIDNPNWKGKGPTTHAAHNLGQGDAPAEAPLTKGRLRRAIKRLEARLEHVHKLIEQPRGKKSPSARTLDWLKAERAATITALRIMRAVRDANLLEGIVATERASQAHKGVIIVGDSPSAMYEALMTESAPCVLFAARDEWENKTGFGFERAVARVHRIPVSKFGESFLNGPEPAESAPDPEKITPADLGEAGYRIEYAAPETTEDPDLVGKYWWTFTRDGWVGVDVSLGQWDSLGDAIDDAYKNMREEARASSAPTTKG